MDTKEKNRDGTRRPRQDAPPRQAERTVPRREQPPRRRPPEEPAPRQRRTPPQDASVPRTAPQGTGPRKSAPQPTAQERAVARKKAEARQREAQKRAAENSRKKNALRNMLSDTPQTAEPRDRLAESQRRKARQAAAAEHRRRQARRHDTPAVIYTAPQAFNRHRLFVQLLTVTAVVVALVMGMSIFFKVKTVTVAGSQVYSAWTVREASGIQEGDNLLTFNRARANAQIRAKLPYVEKSRIGIKLPDTVILYIEEMDVAYAIQSDDSTWWLMNSGGRVVEQIDGRKAEEHTQILGITLDNPKAGEDAVAMEDAPIETDESGEYIPAMVTGAQRLHSAMQILKALEDNDIVGQAASVNVSFLDDIILWYGTRFQINLGDTGRMDYKIACMNDGIAAMSQYDSGILDVSFSFWQDQIGYTPFE